MENIFNFLIDIGKLKNIERRGVTFYGIDCPDSALDHSFRVAIMVWILGKDKDINLGRAIKMALIHDVCKVYSGDITPYDNILPSDLKKRREVTGKWRRLSKKDKEKFSLKKFKQEKRALVKLIANLPHFIKKEILDLWLEYNQLLTPEAKFVNQVDVLENLLEAFECFKQDKNFPTKPWWQHAEEVIEDKTLLGFLKEVEKQEIEIM